jgi:hypothetical protein
LRRRLTFGGGVILNSGLILGVAWFWVAQRFSAAIEAIILSAALAAEAGRASRNHPQQESK